MGASPAVVAGAIVSGNPPRCPRFRGFWAFSEGTELAYPQRCNRWDCSYCGKWKRLVARFALARGVALALERGERVRFVTLTDPSGTMSVEDWTRAWKRLSLRLSKPRKGRKVKRDGRWVWKVRRRPAYMKAAAVAIEAHASGALHIHALLLGKYIPQAWLSRQAKEVGLGRVTHITALRPHTNPTGIADYLAPSGTGGAAPIEKMTAAAYLTASKHGIGPVAARSGKRVRPLRFSRDWPARPGTGGAMTKAEEDLIAFLFADQDEDDGPFEMWAESQLWDEIQAIRKRHKGRSALEVPW